MGDRGNIAVRQKTGTNTEDVWFYTHWSGSEIQTTVQAVLKRNQRLNDPPYFTRILFQELVGDDKGSTGFGISTSIGDNEHDIVVVDLDAKRVFLVAQESLADGRLKADPEFLKSYTFDEFGSLDLDTVEA